MKCAGTDHNSSRTFFVPNVSGPRIYGGPSGLDNTSETCYMNSMIQAIASSEVLIKEYDELLENFKNAELLRLLRDLLKNINAPSDRRRCINDNTEKLRHLMICSRWDAKSQQDSFHLLSAVINAVQRDIKDLLDIENRIMPPKLNMLHVFTENYIFNKVQNHLALALPLCGNFRDPNCGVALTELIDAYFMPSNIDDSPFATQMFLYEKVPSVFIIHIQANEWDARHNAYIKPKYYIKFDPVLTYTFTIQMKEDCTEMKKMKANFQLKAVVHHMGTATGGHYVTYRMHNDDWYLANDVHVDMVMFTNKIIPYIMVYEKIDDEEVSD